MSRILLVDDDPGVRETFKDMLEDHGHEVMETWNGTTALRMFERFGPFDAVLTDFQMPGILGNELAVKIRERDPNIPIAVASGDYSNDRKIPQGVAFLRKGSITWPDIRIALHLPEETTAAV